MLVALQAARVALQLAGAPLASAYALTEVRLRLEMARQEPEPRVRGDPGRRGAALYNALKV